jgi:hypothetical protein
MARRREEERELERGRASVLYRPRVETFAPEGIDDLQRLMIVLAPDGRRRRRVITVGRKRLPASGRHERFWGFVDLVLDSEADLKAALDAHTYATKTRGVRHLPAARPVARGTYKIAWHESHAHLKLSVTDIVSDDPVVDEIALESQMDYIVSVANPDPAAWGLEEQPPLQMDLFDEIEVHVTLPTPFPPRLQARFRDNRYAQLDTIEFLDHPGAELVFIAER